MTGLRSAGLAAAISSLAACAGGDPGEHRRPNLLLVTIDTLRADHLGCYGYFRDTSPHLDRLAEESVLFERAYAPIATTLPSHLSLLTGVYPIEHGVLANVKHGGLRFTPGSNLSSAAQVARSAGYSTAAFVSAAPLARETGVAHGFEVFREPDGASQRATITAGWARDWFAAWSGEQPFFVWVHFYDPHGPYDPPPPYSNRFRTDDDLLALAAERRLPRSISERGRTWNVLEAINRYDGEISLADAEIGRVLDAVREREAWDETIVIVAGDHGESLGEHDEMQHGCIHDGQLRTLLLIRDPDLSPSRVAAPVSLVDVFATVVRSDWHPAWRALVEQSSGANVLSPDHRSAAAFGQRTSREREDLHPFAYTLTSAAWKFVHEPHGGEERLYDLGNDPFERVDVAATEDGVLAEMRSELGERLELQRRRREAFRGDEVGDEEMDPERLEQLRALGYTD